MQSLLCKVKILSALQRYKWLLGILWLSMGRNLKVIWTTVSIGGKEGNFGTKWLESQIPRFPRLPLICKKASNQSMCKLRSWEFESHAQPIKTQIISCQELRLNTQYMHHIWELHKVEFIRKPVAVLCHEYFWVRNCRFYASNHVISRLRESHSSLPKEIWQGQI